MELIQLGSYSIFVGDIWAQLGDFLEKRNYSRHFILVDENTEQHCLPLVEKYISADKLTVIKIPSGEIHKHIGSCQIIWSALMAGQADRQSLLINLGGGVIGDMGGFCASTFKRGMDFIQLPTTLLSQVDASIGGKLGIDFEQIKNSIGLFQNPQAVFIQPEFLKTLSSEEVRSGFAELIKHGLIADVGEWNKIIDIKDLKQVEWIDYIVPSLYVKKRIVEEDPLEKGLRKALNFGHTIGHAIEGYALETAKPLLHGEAVAAGMIAESYLSHKILGLSQQSLEEITRFILNTYDLYAFSKTLYPTFLNLMQQDKKNEDGLINFSLLPGIGEVEVNQTCNQQLIEESLDYLNDKISTKEIA
jgi:3-dehydroquinate synthase